MRKIALILVFSLMLCNSISAEDLLHYFDTSRIEESAEKNSNIDFSNLFNNIITGNFDEVKSDIIDNVKELFLENLQKNISNIKLLCVICLLIGLFKNAVNGIEEKGIKGITKDNVKEVKEYISSIKSVITNNNAKITVAKDATQVTIELTK